MALSREIPSLTGVVIGARWDAGAETVLDDNLVFAAILCNARSQAISSDHFVFFNQLQSPDLSVTQLEEALGGDREQIEVDLPGVPSDVERLVFVVYVNDGGGARRTLGQLKQCFVRVLNRAGNQELVRSEDFARSLTDETGLSLCELYRHDNGWKFKVLGQGYANGVIGIAADFGVPT